MSDKHNPYEAKDTGHEWDGIRELDNPPPKWWMIGLYVSIISVVIYCVLFPSVPLLNDSTKGVLNWTQIKRLKGQIAEIEAVRAPYESKLAGMSAAQILSNPELSNFSKRSAKVIFGDFCAPCHGVGGQGGPDYPVLADDDWLYGGQVETIIETITDGRAGMMPSHGATLSQNEIDDVVEYVAGLTSGNSYDPGRAVFLGQTSGEAACAACHGEDAKGNPDMGAPNLTDAVWRFASDKDTIRNTIVNGVNDEENPNTKKAQMPSFEGKLSATQIKKLAVLIHQFGGGQN